MMLVILLGQIDLSVPWVATAGAMMACAVAGFGSAGAALAIPFGVLCGVGFGLVNGIGVAYLRIPSMIVTLATNVVAQGLMVVYTGGFSPQDSAPPAMRWLATGFADPGAAERHPGLDRARAPAWCSCSPAPSSAGRSTASATASGRPISRASPTRRVVMTAFALSGGLAAFGGVLLAGYASKAAQAMGDAYLLPAIAAVVLGGTSILGGRGSYLGTVAGAILITLLQSILSVMQMPEAGRQIVYGIVIVVMLLLYGRSPPNR